MRVHELDARNDAFERDVRVEIEIRDPVVRVRCDRRGKTREHDADSGAHGYLR
jgi:hypothetical protein